MKAVILAGGLGTRLSEETALKPKPMVEIGGKPIIWHIMKIFSYHGINDFIVCCGYKGYIIKEYFSNYFLHNSDVNFNFKENSTKYLRYKSEPWNVTVVDTGDASMTGGRLLRVKEYLKDDKVFCFTYGDGVADIDIKSLIKYHESHGKTATVTTSFPPGRFGALEIKNDLVTGFKEKPKGDGLMVNAGFFVLNSNVFDYIENDQTVWEEEPLSNLTNDKQLYAYKHSGFWKPMDTLLDKVTLNDIWNTGKAPWKIW